MVQDIIIVGAGSVGGHVVSNAEAYGIHGRILGFLDDDPKKIASEFCGYPIISSLEWLKGKSDIAVIVGIAFPQVKKNIYDKYLDGQKFTFPSLWHPSAWISKGCSIGQGSIVYPNTSINYGSIIGSFCVLNMNCAIGHHSEVGHFTSLAPGVNLGGHTTLGNQVEMGIGSCTLQNLSIGDYAEIGGQAMVVDSLPSYSKSKGVPAKADKNDKQ